MSDERCTVEGCFHVVRRLRLCNKHLQRLLKWGSPTKTLAAPRFVPPFRGRPQP